MPRDTSFSEREPLAVLSHNLDFWLPYAITVTEGVMGTFERVEPETEKQKQQLEMARKEDFEEVWIERPRKGGTLWMGEEEAADALCANMCETSRPSTITVGRGKKSHFDEHKQDKHFFRYVDSFGA